MVLGGVVDDEWLARRRRFYEARVKARSSGDLDGINGLVVAGLHRELAAVALLSGDTAVSREHFKAAGDLQVRYGQAQGLMLLGLAGSHRVFDEPLAQTIMDVAARLDDPPTAEAPRRSGAELFAPLQWLSVVQAAALARPDSGDEMATLIKRLRPQGSVLLPNGLPLGLYLDLLSPRAAAADGAGDHAIDVAALLDWRRRSLRIARDDTYHWKTSLDPAALIDFDLVALFLSRPIPEFFNAAALVDSDDEHLEWLPIILAERLRTLGSGYLQTT